MVFRHSLQKCLSLVLIALGVAAPAVKAQTLDTPAPYAMLVDASTNTVLMEKNADAQFPPASMSKMMTVYVAFRMIKDGSISLSDRTVVSDETWRKWRLQGSTMYLNAGDDVSVGDLLRGIIVQSGNDASVVLAETLAGSEEAFAEIMNDVAQEIGLTGSHFVNATGWPNEEHLVTARDLATLALRTISDFPDLYALYGERTFAYGPEANHSNRNPLLGQVEGADGLKTGHTEEAGYGLTGSAIRDGRRIVLVVAGLDSMAQRAQETRRLMERAFRDFRAYTLFAAGETVEEANVWLGADAKVPLVVSEDVRLSLSRAARNRMTVQLAYDGPIPAPIQTGTPLATLTISAPGMDDRQVPLYAGAEIDSIGGFGRIGAAFRYLLFGAAGAN